MPNPAAKMAALPADKEHRHILEAGCRAVDVAAGCACATDAVVENARNGIVERVGVRLRLGIEEVHILGVGHLVFADVVGVIHFAVAGGVSRIPRIAD